MLLIPSASDFSHLRTEFPRQTMSVCDCLPKADQWRGKRSEGLPGVFFKSISAFVLSWQRGLCQDLLDFIAFMKWLSHKHLLSYLFISIQFSWAWTGHGCAITWCLPSQSCNNMQGHEVGCRSWSESKDLTQQTTHHVALLTKAAWRAFLRDENTKWRRNLFY